MKSTIYISYAWGISDESEETIAVMGLCKALSDYGFNLVLDKTHLDYHQSLPDFFKVIGYGGIVIPIVGKRYLQRLNCLIEAAHMINRGDIQERIFPLVLSDNHEIYDTLRRPAIINELEQYWSDKEKELSEAIDFSHSLGHGRLPFRHDVNLLHQVISTISEFVSHIGTSKQFSLEHELKNNFTPFIEFILSRTRKKVAKPYYQKFEGEYFGREEDIKFVDDFIMDDSHHFLLLYGVGGMGKSHLLSICLEKNAIGRTFYWVKADRNFELKDLFKACNLRFPVELVSNKEICNRFLEEFTSEEIFLIIDDFYEIIDVDVRELLPDLSCLPAGKLLLISRAVPKEIEKQKVYHLQLPALKREPFKQAMYAYISTENKRTFSDAELDKIFDKAQGYPLGGHLIIRLADFGDKLDDILNDLPKFEAELDEEGKRFSERLLDNIFNKAGIGEISLLCEFSALFGFSSIDVIRKLPSFKIENFNSLVNRRKFINNDGNAKYSSHAMIKDYAYEKLSNKEEVHRKIGNYFEEKLKESKNLDWDLADSIILHYKKVGKRDLEFFGQRMFLKFRNRDVKSIIEQSLQNTIRNYNSLLEIYPNYLPYYNELGMTYRNNHQDQRALLTFQKGLEKSPGNVVLLNELGITYRESGKYQLAIDTFLQAININNDSLPSYNELGRTYRQMGQNQLAINTFKKAIRIKPDQIPSYNELGITYREIYQNQNAINIFLEALVIDPKQLPLYNELGITYREAGLKQEAIDIFLKGLKVEKDNVRIINELAITYRENKLYKEAIDRCKQSLCTDPQNKWAALNLLQIYLFFEPDKAKAIKYYEQSLQPPQITGFKNQKKSLHSIIENLDEILRLESDEIRFYEKYTYLAIQHKAYHSILPFLYKLNEKFPHSFKIISRLGKTLSNQVIARAEEGCVFLKEAISLFQQEQNEKEMQDHLVFYFNNLLFNEKLELLEEELQFYKQEIKFNYTYNLFRANYSIKQEKPEEEIINLFEEALETAELKAEKLKVIHALLKYLSTIEQKNYTDLVKKLITITAEIVKN